MSSSLITYVEKDDKVKVNNIETARHLIFTGTGETVTEDPVNDVIDIDIPSGGVGSGEINTASNAGVDGVGVTLPKSGVNLPFKAIHNGSARITVTDDTADKTIDIDVSEPNLNIGSMTGTIGDTRISDVSYSKLSGVPGTIVQTNQSNTFGVFANEFGGPTLYDSYQDIKTIATPANPSTNYVRLYAKAIDANNFGLFMLTLESGTVQEIRIA